MISFHTNHGHSGNGFGCPAKTEDIITALRRFQDAASSHVKCYCWGAVKPFRNVTSPLPTV